MGIEGKKEIEEKIEGKSEWTQTGCLPWKEGCPNIEAGDFFSSVAADSIAAARLEWIVMIRPIPLGNAGQNASQSAPAVSSPPPFLVYLEQVSSIVQYREI